MKQFISIKSECGWDIPAIVTTPDNIESPIPFVCMIHGTASSKDEVGNCYERFSDALAKEGIASIRYDAVGNGDSTADYINYTMSVNVKDAISCITYMKAQPQFDENRCGVLGWSQGGTIALLTAGRYPGIQSVVTWAGAVTLTDLAGQGYEEALATGSTTWTFDFRGPLTVSINWFNEARSIDTLQEFSSYSGAILACAGSIDDVVPPENIYEIYNTASGKKDTYLVEGADHIYNCLTGDYSKFDELSSKTINWFKETL